MVGRVFASVPLYKVNSVNSCTKCALEMVERRGVETEGRSTGSPKHSEPLLQTGVCQPKRNAESQQTEQSVHHNSAEVITEERKQERLSDQVYAVG